MTTLYTLNKRVNNLLPKVANKYNLKLEIESEYHHESVERNEHVLELWVHHTLSNKVIKRIESEYYEMTSNCKTFKYPLIQAPQIRQILNILVDVLGDCYDLQLWQEEGDLEIPRPPDSEAERLCQIWLDGLKPLIDREPETVLIEFAEILEDLLKE